MKSGRETELFKFVFLGIVWAISALTLASVISAITIYAFRDILFIEGLTLLGIGVLSSINEEELCGSIRGTGGFNYQYISNELQAIRNEDKIITLDTSPLNMDMIIGGIISIIMLLL